MIFQYIFLLILCVMFEGDLRNHNITVKTDASAVPLPISIIAFYILFMATCHVPVYSSWVHRMGNLLDRHGRLVEGHSGHLEDMDKVVHKTMELQMTEMAFHQGLDKAVKGCTEIKKELQRLRRSHGLLARRVRLLERHRRNIKQRASAKGQPHA